MTTTHQPDHEFPVDDSGRHILTLTREGKWEIAGHQGMDTKAEAYDAECRNLEAALIMFKQTAARRDLDTALPAALTPGRYWCSVDDDGNFAIGGRVQS